MPLTTDARTDFVRNVAALSLWLAARRAAEGGSFRQVLTAQTPMYRLTALWDGTREGHPARGHKDPRWEALLGELESLARDNPAGLEPEGLALLWPLMSPRIALDVAQWPWIPNALGATPLPDRLHGMFLFEFFDGPAKADAFDLHMGNPFSPQSPFADVRARAADLLALLDDVQSRRPGLAWLECTSWMNSFPPFVRLFPPGWPASASAPHPPSYTYGLWGQMVDRAGGFHRGHGEHLRRTGEFLYPSTTNRCRIAELRRHLGG